MRRLGRKEKSMHAITPIVRATGLLLAALVVGTGFGVWLGYDPRDLTAAVYVAQQQHAIRALNVTMPVLGAITIVLTIATAVLARGQRVELTLLLAAAACLIAALLITRFCNQPINAIVRTWSPEAPPSNWMQLRDTWWQWHVLRTFVALAGLSCLIAANVVWRGADVGPRQRAAVHSSASPAPRASDAALDRTSDRARIGRPTVRKDRGLAAPQDFNAAIRAAQLDAPSTASRTPESETASDTRPAPFPSFS
jgi:uncharacterized membrane protein